MRKGKGIKLSELSLDPKDLQSAQPVPMPNISGPAPKKRHPPEKKAFIPEYYVILFTLEGHTTWRVFSGFWHQWEAMKKNGFPKITASRVFKLVRLTGEFYETPN